MESKESKCPKKSAFDALNNANQWILIAHRGEKVTISVCGGPELMEILATCIKQNSELKSLISSAVILAVTTL